MSCGLRRTGGLCAAAVAEIPSAAGLFRRAAVFPRSGKSAFFSYAERFDLTV